MSATNTNARYPQSRTDTVIGPGACVEGNLTFTGVLRIQGDVHGDVSCERDATGTIVVGQTGKLTGAVKAPHIVVGGRVVGPLQSAESVEIQPGATVVGDVSYAGLDIHAGGVIEGALAPREAKASRNLPEEADRHCLVSPAGKTPEDGAGKAAAVGSFRARITVRHLLAATFVVLSAATAVLMSNRETLPVADVALRAEAQAKAPEGSATSGGGVQQDLPKSSEGGTALLADSAKSAAAGNPEPAPSAADTSAEVVVQGVNPGKPAGVFSVISKEAAVLLRKKRQDESGGTRIEVPRGATMSITIGSNELFRVDQGRNLEIFYQGRKVTPKTIQSGAWMSFVPQSAAAAGTKK